VHQLSYVKSSAELQGWYSTTTIVLSWGWRQGIISKRGNYLPACGLYTNQIFMLTLLPHFRNNTAPLASH